MEKNKRTHLSEKAQQDIMWKNLQEDYDEQRKLPHNQPDYKEEEA